jgi:Domain of Unknown Function (DUF1259)
MEASMRSGSRRPMLGSLLSCAGFLIAATSVLAATPDWQTRVDQIIGWKGQQMPDNVLRFTLTPHLRLSVAGIPVRDNLVLDGYAAFRNEGTQVLMVAEVVAPADNAPAVVRAATAAGLQVSAVHNHVIHEHPHVIFVHMSGYGDPAKLAQGLKSALGAAKLSLHRDDDEEDADDVAPGLNASQLDSILRSQGMPVDGVLEYTFDRPESFTLDGHVFPPAMGPESEVHFQSLAHGKAAEVAEIALLPAEVPKALAVLRAHGQQVEVTALHNHFLTEDPRLFFVHTWGVGDAASLARTLRQVIDQTPQQ